MKLTPAELSARWKGTIKPGTLANWRAKKIGPPYEKIGGRVLYPEAQLVEWESKNTYTTESEKPDAKP